MVAKCVNPSCSERFTYFGRGELLLKSSAVTGYQELFWICERCKLVWQPPIDLVPMGVASLATKTKKKDVAA
jgi:hypothetical protein